MKKLFLSLVLVLAPFGVHAVVPQETLACLTQFWDSSVGEGKATSKNLRNDFSSGSSALCLGAGDFLQGISKEKIGTFGLCGLAPETHFFSGGQWRGAPLPLGSWDKWWRGLVNRCAKESLWATFNKEVLKTSLVGRRIFFTLPPRKIEGSATKILQKGIRSITVQGMGAEGGRNQKKKRVLLPIF